MLIEHSIAEAKRLGYDAIVLGGFPYHYHPYGFIGTKSTTFQCLMVNFIQELWRCP